MDKEDIKRLGNDPRFISGIHNYCDRWCERCPFTARCMNFAMGEEQFADPETQDLNNEAFWEKLSETFQVTLDLLKEMAEEAGVDLDSLDIEEAKEEENYRKEVAESHKCSRAARAYGKTVDEWFDSAIEMFGQKEDESERQARPGIPSIGPLAEDTTLADTTQVIRWYQHQIYVKIMRAVHGSLKEESEELDEFPRDSDGSAKVALIGIDRSISAWGEMRGFFPMLENSILDILVHLERLRRQTENTFPAAREFIRPGFDKVKLNG
ncbi:MAG: hypothetical protein JRJ86_02040 [Deltaproteobacteria bacterium]|nr:hypothetical protein [Deltaproteobacteria bacterium]MBW2344090.1 hypothetical protein [Deltaproteobacteria bacterium]